MHFRFIKTWFQSPKLCLSRFSVLVKRFNTFSCILTLIILQSAIIFVDNRKGNLTNSKSSYWFFFFSPFSCLEYDILENNTALVLTSLSWVCKTGNIFTLYVSKSGLYDITPYAFCIYIKSFVHHHIKAWLFLIKYNKSDIKSFPKFSVDVLQLMMVIYDKKISNYWSSWYLMVLDSKVWYGC